MTIIKEIRELETEIKSLEKYCDDNCHKDLHGEELRKLSDSIESVIFNQEKLKELKLKLEKEKNLTLKIKQINKSLNMQVVSRERNYDDLDYNFINGFYPEKIEIMFADKVVPLNYEHDSFYISYKNHGGKGIFNPYNDVVESKHKFYTKERA